MFRFPNNTHSTEPKMRERYYDTSSVILEHNKKNNDDEEEAATTVNKIQKCLKL